MKQPSSKPLNPGDEARPGTPGTGEEDICPECNGKGKTARGETCRNCGGTGKIVRGIGGA
jgi:DnaJ-class molecular chaperone